MRNFKGHRFFLTRHFTLLFCQMPSSLPALKAAAHKGSELVEIILQRTFVKQLLNLGMNFPSRCLLSHLFRKFFWKNIWVEEGMKQGCPRVPALRGGGLKEFASVQPGLGSAQRDLEVGSPDDHSTKPGFILSHMEHTDTGKPWGPAVSHSVEFIIAH